MMIQQPDRSQGWSCVDRGRFIAIALAISLAWMSCTLANRVEVCRAAPEPVSVNQDADGEQTLESPYSVTVMPSGEVLVLFSSTMSGRAASDALEVRSVRLSSAGVPMDGCTARNEREQTLYPVLLADDTLQTARAVQVLPAPNARGITFTGLALLIRELGATSRELVAVPIQPQGCFSDSPSTINVPRANAAVAPPDVSPRVVALPEQGGTQPYAVFWVENDMSVGRVAMARMIRVQGGFFLPAATATAPTGDPIDLRLPGGPIIDGLDAIATGPEEILLVWLVADISGFGRILMQRFDLELRPSGPALLLVENLSLGSSLPGSRVLSAFDGEHVLVLWAQGRDDGSTRIVAQSILPDGRSVGTAEVVGAASAANDSLATLAGLSDGGFVVAWRQQVSSSTTGVDEVSLRMVALDTYGRRAFSNMACKESDFALASAGGGDIRQASAAVAPDGRVLVAYAVTETGEAARFQSEIKLISLAPGDLFPAGALRPTTSERGRTGPSPLSYGGEHPSCQGMAGLPGRSCTCDNKCNDVNALCRTEELTGRAGGTCYIECDPEVADSCPIGSACVSSSTIPAGGSCGIGCARDADCGTGRVCFVDAATCWIMCAGPADCRTGICDTYSGNCANVNGNPEGGGLLASCDEDLDCRSLHCAEPDDPLSPKRCQSYCRVDQPTCPEDGVCVGLSGNLGMCFPPCVVGKCKAGLTCYDIPGYTEVPVCMS